MQHEPSWRQHIYARMTRIERKLDILLRAAQLEVERDVMAQADIDNVRAQVARTREVSESVKILLADIARRLRESADDPAELQALAAELSTNADSLAAAVTENTPSA